MNKFLICEFGGKQYKVFPNKPISVNIKPSVKEIEAKVLLNYNNGEVQTGKPYLKDGIRLAVLKNFAGEKVRVSKFRAKSNYRKVKGFRAKLAQVSWNP